MSVGLMASPIRFTSIRPWLSIQRVCPCGADIRLRCNRDIGRKRFCSRPCKSNGERK